MAATAARSLVEPGPGAGTRLHVPQGGVGPVVAAGSTVPWGGVMVGEGPLLRPQRVISGPERTARVPSSGDQAMPSTVLPGELRVRTSSPVAGSMRCTAVSSRSTSTLPFGDQPANLYLS